MPTRREPFGVVALLGVAVEGELAQRPRQGGSPAAQDGEHRPAHAGPPLDVEDGEIGADLPVGDALVGTVRVRVVALDPQDRVVGVGRPVGRVG